MREAVLRKSGKMLLLLLPPVRVGKHIRLRPANLNGLKRFGQGHTIGNS